MDLLIACAGETRPERFDEVIANTKIRAYECLFNRVFEGGSEIL